MGSRKTEPGVEQTYDAAKQWVARVLRGDDSLFTPGKAVWTPEVLDEVRAGFMDNPDPGQGTTLQKLEHQLTGSTPEAYQLAAEALYFVYLTPHVPSIRPVTKLARVRQVLGWSGQEIAIPDDLIAGLAPGIATIGTAFASGLPAYLGFIIEFVERWKQTQDDIEGCLQDPWAFKKFVADVSSSFQSALLRLPNYAGKTIVQRHALLHLVHPDTFEPIVSEGQKNTIAEKLGSYATASESDVDRNILQIRQALEGELGSDFQFHDEGIRERWNYSGNQPPPPPPVVPPPTEGLQALANQTYLPVSFLGEVESLLAEKGQVIFQGPPGTGKTYVAQALARHLAGSGDDAAGRVRLVQFHPSYAYEDFVQGFRPKQMDGGQVGFELRKGPLLEIAEKAKQDKDNRYYLIIDEINRGALATVFGELYFLLEYRGEKMRLQYSDKDFSLPKNLFIIGTMNTADRSIAMVDLALRRRFYFVEFLPGEEPVKSVLRRYLEENPTNAGWVEDVVDKANDLLKTYGASDAAIGPSYFMREGLDEDGVKRIWKHSVLPYIAERLFDDRERLAEFDLEKLKGNAPD